MNTSTDFLALSPSSATPALSSSLTMVVYEVNQSYNFIAELNRNHIFLPCSEDSESDAISSTGEQGEVRPMEHCAPRLCSSSLVASTAECRSQEDFLKQTDLGGLVDAVSLKLHCKMCNRKQITRVVSWAPKPSL